MVFLNCIKKTDINLCVERSNSASILKARRFYFENLKVQPCLSEIFVSILRNKFDTVSFIILG